MLFVSLTTCVYIVDSESTCNLHGNPKGAQQHLVPNDLKLKVSFSTSGPSSIKGIEPSWVRIIVVLCAVFFWRFTFACFFPLLFAMQISFFTFDF